MLLEAELPDHGSIPYTALAITMQLRHTRHARCLPRVRSMGACWMSHVSLRQVFCLTRRPGSPPWDPVGNRGLGLGIHLHAREGRATSTGEVVESGVTSHGRLSAFRGGGRRDRKDRGPGYHVSPPKSNTSSRQAPLNRECRGPRGLGGSWGLGRMSVDPGSWDPLAAAALQPRSFQL